MREGWTLQRVDEFADLCLGKMLDKAKNRGSLQPYLRNLNVRWFEFDLTNLIEMKFEDSELERYTARAGDLMVCEGGYPGRAAIWDGDPICFQKAVHRVRCHEPQRAKWLLYFLLKSDVDGTLRQHFTGTAIQHFTGQAFRKLVVPLPPLAEQQRIVAILDEAFEAIAAATANAEKNLADADEFFEQARRIAVEGDRTWQSRSFEECLDPVRYTPKVQRRSFLRSGRFPIISQESEFINGWWDEPDHVFTVDRPLVIFGDHTRVLKYVDFDFVLGADGVKVLCPNHHFHPRFFYHFVSSVDIGEKGYARHYRVLKERKVLFPDLATQGEIATRLDAIESDSVLLKETFACKLAALAELKQSLLARAFSGALTAGHGEAAPHTPSLRAEGEATQGRRTGGGSLRRSAPRDDGGKGASRDDGGKGASRDGAGKGTPPENQPPIPTFPAAAKRSAGTQGPRTDG